MEFLGFESTSRSVPDQPLDPVNTLIEGGVGWSRAGCLQVVHSNRAAGFGMPKHACCAFCLCLVTAPGVVQVVPLL
jgi:hypothetical protein